MIDYDSNNTPIFYIKNGISPMNVQDVADGDDNLINILKLVDKVELTSYKNNIIYYIAGYIIRNFTAGCICKYCLDIVSVSNTRDHSYAIDLNCISSFISFVSRGKLLHPSPAVFHIIQYAEKVFQSFISSGKVKDNHITTLVVHLGKLLFVPKIKTLFTPEHPITTTCEVLHKLQIISYLTKTYVTLRLKAFSKKQNIRRFREKEQSLPKTQ